MLRHVLPILLFLSLLIPVQGFQNTSQYALVLKDFSNTQYATVYRSTGVAVGNWKFEVDFWNVTDWDNAFKFILYDPGYDSGVQVIVRSNGSHFVIEVFTKTPGGFYQYKTSFYRLFSDEWHEIQVDRSSSYLYLYFDNSYMGSVTYSPTLRPRQINLYTMASAQNSYIYADDLTIKDGSGSIIWLEDWEDGDMQGWSEISNPPATDVFVSLLPQIYPISIQFTLLSNLYEDIKLGIRRVVQYVVSSSVSTIIFLAHLVTITYTIISSVISEIYQAIQQVLNYSVLSQVGINVFAAFERVIQYVVTSSVISDLIQNIELLISYIVTSDITRAIFAAFERVISYTIIGQVRIDIFAAFERVIQYIINFIAEWYLGQDVSSSFGGQASYTIDITVSSGGSGGSGGGWGGGPGGFWGSPSPIPGLSMFHVAGISMYLVLGLVVLRLHPLAFLAITGLFSIMGLFGPYSPLVLFLTVLGVIIYVRRG